jgi:hypothetical protein
VKIDTGISTAPRPSGGHRRNLCTWHSRMAQRRPRHWLHLRLLAAAGSRRVAAGSDQHSRLWAAAATATALQSVQWERDQRVGGVRLSGRLLGGSDRRQERVSRHPGRGSDAGRRAVAFCRRVPGEEGSTVVLKVSRSSQISFAKLTYLASLLAKKYMQ